MNREMKESGVEWIGQVPQHWELNYLNQFFNQVKNKNAGLIETNLLSLSHGNIVTRNIESNKGLLPDNFEGYNIIHPGDIVLRMTDLQNDQTSLRVGLSKQKGIITSAYITIRKNNVINEEYAYYYLHSFDICKGFYGMGAGVRQGITYDGLKKLGLLYPPIEEQQKIVNFLNEKVNKINTLIEDAELSIEEYKRFRQSLISEIVVTGINPQVEMKESGIEWVKEIPKHWKVINSKHLFTQRKEKAKLGERQLTASQKYGVIYQDEFMKLENQKVVTVEKDFNILKHVEPNDFVISMRSFQGGLEYSKYSGSISSAYVMLIPNEKVYSPYFKWLFKSFKYINALQSTSNLVRDGQAMRYSNFVQIPLFEVPMEEQKQIADFLNVKCFQIDGVIEQKQKLIIELKEYKNALIYECVTGKREVL
ncbi:restriction endonuclease subunit S [Bacillus cereus group sp. MYBK185-1]|uniref:restriction endonuclease subunit S n=1 Tax=Bacillus cereus group sp. MYBK185-1 TaxID=3450672 RepID=UPI003F796413